MNEHHKKIKLLKQLKKHLNKDLFIYKDTQYDMEIILDKKTGEEIKIDLKEGECSGSDFLLADF